MEQLQHAADIAALRFYLDHGVDEVVGDKPVDRFKVVEKLPEKAAPVQNALADVTAQQAPLPMGKSDAYKQALELAQKAESPEELREAIATFDGVALKKTATNLVFCDGNPEAKVMLVGEAPGADEDRQGKPFVGVSGQLLDKILGCIDLGRTAEEANKAVYISNILNWRPPGNRTPAPAEVEVSLPFIERHIQLIKPKLLILCGGVSAKALLGTEDSVSKLRRVGWHDYLPQTAEFKENAEPIPAIVTYHPAYLLRTPAQKKAVWADMLALQAKYRSL